MSDELVTQYPLRGEDFPCIICGKALRRAFDEQGQPADGVVCTTGGNYGSTVFDPLDGLILVFNICDECLVAKKAFIKLQRTYKPVVMTYLGVVGAEHVDRPYLDWVPGMEDHDERTHIEPDELDSLPEHVELHRGLTPQTLRESFAAEEDRRGNK